MGRTIGIDLGTTNSAVSLIQDGKPEVFRDENLLATLPSVVGFAGPSAVGSAVPAYAMTSRERLILP